MEQPIPASAHPIFIKFKEWAKEREADCPEISGLLLVINWRGKDTDQAAGIFATVSPPSLDEGISILRQVGRLQISLSESLRSKLESFSSMLSGRREDTRVR